MKRKCFALKKHNYSSRFLAFTLMVVMLLSFGATAQAAPDDLGSITVKFPVEDALYRVYYAGTFVDNKIVLDGDYGYINLDDLASAAATLADVYTMKNIQPTAVGRIKDGKAVFSGLRQGIYLLAGERAMDNGKEYIPTPTFVPVLENEGGEPSMDPVVTNKFSSRVPPTKLSVLKEWASDDIDHPASVKIQLLRNGTPEGEPVVLSRDNNWRYGWDNLDPESVWTAVEIEVPEGYQCTMNHSGDTFVFFNTRVVPPTTIPPVIPQTGQLWWPVYALVFVGMAFLVLGMTRRRKSEEDA